MRPVDYYRPGLLGPGHADGALNPCRPCRPNGTRHTLHALHALRTRWTRGSEDRLSAHHVTITAWAIASSHVRPSPWFSNQSWDGRSSPMKICILHPQPVHVLTGPETVGNW